MALSFSGDAGFRPRPELGPSGVSATDIDELDGVRWAKRRVNLRKGPSTEHPVAGSLEAGDEVSLKGKVRNADWLLVATSEGGEAFVYAPLLDDRPPSVSASVPPPTQPPARDTALEATFWDSVKDGDASGFKAYLEQYPDGAFAPLALARLRELVWAPIESSSEPSVFEEYLAGDPNGHFAELARTALRQRIEQADKDMLDGYLARYPRGAAADLARQRLPVATWATIRESDDFGVLLDYLQRYPGSAHDAEARQRLRVAIDESTDVDALDRLVREQSQSAFAQQAQERTVTLSWRAVANSLRMADFDDFLRRHPNSPEASLVPGAKVALERLAASVKAQFSTFSENEGIWVGRDCPRCPEMVVVPAGSYRMGSADGGADERPVHEVTFAAPFAVGMHEVTFAQWDACVSDRGCPRGKDIAKDRGWGRGRRPVIHVSWDDAQRYARWLSGETKKQYRLLSESEWEYAARAGTQTAYSWGDGIGVGRANCRGCGSQWDNRQTAPAGSFAANAWGLHDMHGNVWEWVEDCRNGSYAGAPRDGGAWVSGKCSLRVLRGGSWFDGPSFLRAAYRFRYSTGYRVSSVIGFRVARTLAP